MSSETIVPLSTGLITCIEDIILTSVHDTERQLGINVKIKKKNSATGGTNKSCYKHWLDPV